MNDKLSEILDALQRLYLEGGDNNYAIFTANLQKNYYIQLTGQKQASSFTAEAVSNRYLAPEFKLSAYQKDQLVSLGWRNNAAISPNFYQEFAVHSTDDFETIASQILETFTTVYGLQPDQPLIVNIVLE